MPKNEFDVDQYLQDVLKDAHDFSEQLKKLQKELNKHQQLGLAQKVVYQGLDDQIKNTLVDLNEAFTNLEQEMKSENSVDLKYHLTRIRTLSKDGLKDVNKAIDITTGTKFEGADILDDIKRGLTHFMQWASKKLGQYAGHSQQLKDAMNKKPGHFKPSFTDTMKKLKDEVGISVGQRGHAIANKQDELLKRPRRD